MANEPTMNTEVYTPVITQPIIVTAYGEEYECSKAVKGSDYIRLYDDSNKILVSFSGISNFSGYSISGGSWSAPEPTDAEVVEAQTMYTAMMTDTLLVR